MLSLWGLRSSGAQWQGHSAKVADEFRRLHAKKSTKSAADFEKAMGFAGVLDELLEACGMLRAEAGLPS